jgi:hypothetical protein
LFYRFIAVLLVSSFATITFLSFSSFDNSSSNTKTNPNTSSQGQSLEEANSGSYQNVETGLNLNEYDVNKIINEDMAEVGIAPLNISPQQIDEEVKKVDKIGETEKTVKE